MHQWLRSGVTVTLLAGMGLAFTGCMMKPQGTAQLDQKLQEAGKPYQKPFAQRDLPELPSPATW